METEDKKEDPGIYIVIENNRKQPKDNYRIKSVKVLSILHFACGSLSCCFGIYKFFLKTGYQRNEEPFSTSGEGIIFGIPFLLTGLVGLISINKITYCKISAFLVLSIFSALFGVILALTTLAHMYRALRKEYYPALLSHYALILIGAFEAILGVISASFSCHGCCGCCGTGDVTRDGESSVVYIPQSRAGEDEKPRVVHLNMQELSKASVSGEAIEKDDITLEVEETDKSKTSGKYSRFK